MDHWRTISATGVEAKYEVDGSQRQGREMINWRPGRTQSPASCRVGHRVAQSPCSPPDNNRPGSTMSSPFPSVRKALHDTTSADRRPLETRRRTPADALYRTRLRDRGGDRRTRLPGKDSVIRPRCNPHRRGSPLGGGAGVAAWLRDEMLRPIPVVMMTSSRHGGNDNNGIQYVQRPFRTATLLRTVATALDSAEPLTIDTASQVARHERVTSER